MSFEKYRLRDEREDGKKDREWTPEKGQRTDLEVSEHSFMALATETSAVLAFSRVSTMLLKESNKTGQELELIFQKSGLLA